MIFERIRRKSYGFFGVVLYLVWYLSEDVKDWGYVNLEISKEIRDEEENLDVVII